MENCYHYLFTYNFLNGGNGANATSPIAAFNILKKHGVPVYADYWDPILVDEEYPDYKFLYWMNDYNNYSQGLHNRITEYYNINLGLTYSSLDELKHWINDHGNGEETGGLAVVIGNTGTLLDKWVTSSTFPPGSEHAGEHIITYFASSVSHSLTVVGYNDNVHFDFNGDGQFTNDVDLNGDNIIDLRDREYGAFKLANSWGSDWLSDGGFIWLPYKMVPELNSDIARSCDAVSNDDNLFAIKSSVEHNGRNKLRYNMGYAENANQQIPTEETEDSDLAVFRKQGGCHIMRGVPTYTGPIETAIDFGYWVKENDFGKVFFIIEEVVDLQSEYDGEVMSFSIVDYRWGEEFELESNQTNVPILNNTKTYLFVDYDLIVPGDNQTINSSVTYFSNMVSRFNPLVSSNSTITIQEGVKIDMYNSILTIEEGSTLIIEDNAVITAKRGTSQIIVNGTIQIGDNVSFTADDGSEIQLIINSASSVTMNNTIFNNCYVKSASSSLIIHNCTADNTIISESIGDLTIDNTSDFNNSSVIAYNASASPVSNDNIVTIDNCTFTTSNSNSNSVIEVYGYKYFIISNNTIDNVLNPPSCSSAISVHYSGSSEATRNDNKISNNEIYCSFGQTGDDFKGVTMYSSTADILNNYIHKNGIGIESNRNSQIDVIGNESATYESETQRIKNNTLHQIKATRNAFPITTSWNVIYGTNPLVNKYITHLVDMSEDPDDVDVRYNYWGSGFDADVNLDPERHYLWDPVWNLTAGMKTLSAAQQLYETAQNQVSDSNYVQAKSTFQSVVTTFPDETPAKNALKELLYLEPLAGNDFVSLRDWYLTNSVIASHPALLELAKELAVKCDEKLENYQSAIEWYESIIQDPPTLEDSIFAIIDLEHLYWTMGIDTTLRSAVYMGKLSQYVPESFKELRNERDYLLSLLNKKHSSSTLEENSEESDKDLFSVSDNKIINLPNPFRSTTTFRFSTQFTDDFVINIYDQTGKVVKSLSYANLRAGTHDIRVNLDDLDQGIYYYSFSNKSGVISANKMVLIK